MTASYTLIAGPSPRGIAATKIISLAFLGVLGVLAVRE
jgi:hypothetical protein